jgi:hypothetical protein
VRPRCVLLPIAVLGALFLVWQGANKENQPLLNFC